MFKFFAVINKRDPTMDLMIKVLEHYGMPYKIETITMREFMEKCHGHANPRDLCLCVPTKGGKALRNLRDLTLYFEEQALWPM